MNDYKFKTMRHIEAVRNFLDFFVIELLSKGARHDQSKLEEPEASTYAKHTPKLSKHPYGSDEYKEAAKKLGPAFEHHCKHNPH